MFSYYMICPDNDLVAYLLQGKLDGGALPEVEKKRAFPEKYSWLSVFI